MAESHLFSRRSFLKTACVGAGTLAASNLLPDLPFIGRVLAQSDRVPDLEVRLRAVESEVSILPGSPTRVWVYQGEVIQGDTASLQAIPDSYLGPIFRVHQSQHVRIHFVNDLPEESIIHWHGLILPEAMDAHPHYAIAPGETYVYDFQVINRAGTYWYHPHPHGATATQVYNGLAGLFIVTDGEETAAGLPSDDYDIPLVFQDRSFDADNQLVYITGGMMTQMMTEMMGFLGDNILINGKPEFELDVETRAYRLRLLNGSNFRILKLGWEDGTPLTVIGTDGGLLESPLERPYVTLSPGERVELWVDFSEHTVGSQLLLKSLPFTGVEMGGTMMGGMEMPETTTLPHGEKTTVLKVNVVQESTEALTLPERLSTIQRYALSDAVNADLPRTFEIAMLNEVWSLNGRSFEMDAVADDEIVQANTLEVWEFINVVNESETGAMDGGHGGHDMGNMNMGSGEIKTEDQMAHPMHIHGVQFQILERTVEDAFREGWETVSAGYVDEGWKDTVLLMPGERVKLLMRFGSDLGLYVFHCHNLEHEDLGLMRNYQVQ
ncbi:MAG: bilirubin oxidase [Anaerolineaceae bacterium]|nr:bilirubin oxidase [Anaerolineaceae bacterium]